MIRDVTELEVYRVSLGLLPKVGALLRKMRKGDYMTKDQLERAAKSIPANIAEGFAKRSSAKEFKRFLSIAMGSSDEVVTHLRIVYLEYVELRADLSELAKEYKVLSRRINSLRKNWFSDY